MTWEETIKFIRTKPEYKDLVLQAYFHEDLQLNVRNYTASPEFVEILNIIKRYAPGAKRILDIGCGNGITSVGFALNGYEVDAIEPDPSDTVGANSIITAAAAFNVSDKVHVHIAFAEELQLADNSFDVVFARQSVHHANDIQSFVSEMARTLKKGGLFLTVRDHVVFNEKDKQHFLETHPLHHFYGGENAFSPEVYKEAIGNAGLTLVKELNFFDSVINYFPFDTSQFEPAARDKQIKKGLRKKIGILADSNWIIWLYKKLRNITLLKEEDIPGRMYSYIATK